MVAPSNRPVSPPAAGGRPRRLTISTNCADVEEFVRTHNRCADNETLFLATTQPLPVGPARPFVIRLSNGRPVMQGEGEVIESVKVPKPGSRAGMRIKLVDLDDGARKVHEQLVAEARRTRMGIPPPPLPRSTAASDPPVEAPSAAATAPAEIHGVEEPQIHPLHGLADEDLDSAVESWLAKVSRSRFRNALDKLQRLPSHQLFVTGGAMTLMAFAAGLAMGWGIWAGEDGHPIPAAGAAPAPPSVKAPAPGKDVVAEPSEPTVRAPTTDTATLAELPPEPRPEPQPEPDPTACFATLKSRPRRAEVTWNGQPLGQTPLESTAVPCGPAIVKFNRVRYQTRTLRTSASPGAPALTVARLERPPGILELTSRPDGAVFRVKGRRVGKGPTRAEVEVFERVTISATKPGYRPWKQRIYLRRSTTEVLAALEPIKKKASTPRSYSRSRHGPEP